jgi:hypothetical protein
MDSLFLSQVMQLLNKSIKKNMKQTAVQWFALKLMHLKMNPKEVFEFVGWLEEAKEMEKEQITEAYLAGDCHNETAEQYYNETYGKDA